VRKRWLAAACTSRCSPSRGRAPTSDRWASKAPCGWACARKLEAIADDDAREALVRQQTAAAQDNAKALNAATLFEIDDVIDPADTRRLIINTLAAASARVRIGPHRLFIDTW